MEPKGWLLWKGQICLQFLQLTHQRKGDGDIGWVMQTQKEEDGEEKKERDWEGGIEGINTKMWQRWEEIGGRGQQEVLIFVRYQH